MSETKKYIDCLKEIAQYSKNLDSEIVITILQEVGKDLRAEKKDTTDSEPATPKQKALLEKLGKYKEGMTKQEAFQIIKELNNKNGN